MSTRSEPQLGHLLTGAEGRDAIHIAIIPVVASERLYPGESVELFGKTEKGLHYIRKVQDSGIGIVDPFLKEPVKFGDCVYLFLNPYTITSLRHVWTHPAFTAASFPDVAKDQGNEPA